MKDEIIFNRKMNKESSGEKSRRKKMFSISALLLFLLTFRQTVFMIQTENSICFKRKIFSCQVNLFSI